MGERLDVGHPLLDQLEIGVLQPLEVLADDLDLRLPQHERPDKLEHEVARVIPMFVGYVGHVVAPRVQ